MIISLLEVFLRFKNVILNIEHLAFSIVKKTSGV